MIFIALLPFILFHFFVFTSIVNVKADDDALLAALKGPVQFEQFCKANGVTNSQSIYILDQIFSTQFGILYYMRKHWHCDKMVKKIEEEIDEYDMKECNQYRNCLDSLYTWLNSVHSGHQTEKPKFHTDGLQWPNLTDVIRALFLNWKFYFHPVTMDGTDLRMSFDVDPTSHSHKSTQEFDKIMENFLKKVEKRAIEYKSGEKMGMGNASSASSSSSASSPSSKSAVSLFLDNMDVPTMYYVTDAASDELFLNFVGEKDNLNNSQYFFATQYKSNLGTLYLMRKHWHCANAKKNKFFNKSQCNKFRQFVDILHEYLFRLHNGFAVDKPRPIFKLENQILATQNTVEELQNIGTFYFGAAKNTKIIHTEFTPPKITDYWTEHSTLKLLNEKEVDYLNKETVSFQEATIKMAGEKSDEREISAPTYHAVLRKEFDQQLEAFAKKESLYWTV